MKLLFLAAYYPHPNYLFSGIFNERSASVLSELCDVVEVLVPCPYAPPLLSALSPRWKLYRNISRHEVRNGISVHRLRYLQIPHLGGSFWIDPGVFFWLRRRARKMHQRIGFDAIISFDLVGVGGLAWRLGRYLGIPASGWAIGGDVRLPPNSSYRRVLIQALRNLDIVFYQSRELLQKAAELLGLCPAQMSNRKHVVLPRGIPPPPSLAKAEVRKRIRKRLNIEENQIVVLNVGRVVRDKGIFELMAAMSLVVAENPHIVCVSVGSNPALDETIGLQKKLDEVSLLKERFKVLPSCSPDEVWEYLCAADIFALPSHEEGMPNSLLEAMALGVPAVSFAIPPVLEIETRTGCVVAVPLFDTVSFANAILRLSSSPEERARIGERGRLRVEERFMAHKNMAEAVENLGKLIHKRCGTL
jgi:teichuronic acid biosynthesis glycosyltransferase TuaC